MAHCLGVHLNRFREGNERFVIVADAFETIALSKVPKSVVLLELNDSTEIAQGFLPLLLEDEYLTSGYVGLDVAWVAYQSFRESSQSSLVVVDPAIGDRNHDKHCFTVVRTPFYQVC